MKKLIEKPVLVRGAGDLATGILLRFHRAGIPVIATDIEEPTVIRRTVSLAPALQEGEAEVQGIKGVKAENLEQIYKILEDGNIPIIADPELKMLDEIKPCAVIDAIIAKKNIGTNRDMAPIVIGIGPGFNAGKDVDAVVETQRGHDLGRVLYEGSAVPNTGTPGMIGGYAKERVIHAPAAGIIHPVKNITDQVEPGEIIAYIETPEGEKVPVKTVIGGVLRGMIHPDMTIPYRMKIADVDPRDVKAHCHSVSDKANAIAGGALEAFLHFYSELEQ